ncbi:MAG: LytTR family DNA-binding domain-containing protein [Bacteroidetes bacterium]|nr:LytTR family DNA-binding domain-containing protein [Bacteroidota bacterium]
MNIVIIEDEPKTAKNLEKILQSINNQFRVLEIIDSIESGIAYFEEVGFPDLILSDIQIADGLSFELFDTCPPSCPIIFCTAYDQYALQAFKANGIDYLLKPFSEGDVRKSIEKYKNLKKVEVKNDYFRQLVEQIKKPKRQSILVNFRDKIIPVPVQIIPYFYSSQHSTWLWFEGKELLINYSLEELENVLDMSIFYRANRQFLINRSFVREIEHYFARKLVVHLTLSTPETIVISKAKASEFLRWMET